MSLARYDVTYVKSHPHGAVQARAKGHQCIGEIAAAHRRVLERGAAQVGTGNDAPSFVDDDVAAMRAPSKLQFTQCASSSLALCSVAALKFVPLSSA
jgi:hypothetical protein